MRTRVKEISGSIRDENCLELLRQYLALDGSIPWSSSCNYPAGGSTKFTYSF